MAPAIEISAWGFRISDRGLGISDLAYESLGQYPVLQFVVIVRGSESGGRRTALFSNVVTAHAPKASLLISEPILSHLSLQIFLAA